MAYANKLYYDAIKDKVKQDDQAISMNVPPPRPQAVFGEMALNGTLSINTTLIDNEEFIASPGGLNSDSAPEWYVNGSRGSEPLYNKPVGRFSLLEQPEFGIGIVQNGSSGGAWLSIKKKPYFAHNNSPVGKIDDALTLGIHVQTLDTDGAVQSNIMGDGYSNLFGEQNDNPLPGELDISELIDWDQVLANIATLSNPSEQDIENALSNWIRVSYEVWSITLTNLKSRNLERVMVNGDQYYTGSSSFAYSSSTAFYASQLAAEAEALTESEFSSYDFSDDADFGTTYRLYHTEYDETGDAFYTAMNNYCTALNNAQNPGAKNAEETQDIKGEEVAEAEEEEPIAEELTVAQPGLTVYPNPAQYQVNFRLVSEQAGKAGVTLYDLTGRALIGTTDYIDGVHSLQGHINIASLPAGVYILEVKLPDGKAITKKIVKQ